MSAHLTKEQRDEFYAVWRRFGRIRASCGNLSVDDRAGVEVTLEGFVFSGQKEPYPLTRAKLAPLLEGALFTHETLVDLLHVAAFIVNNGDAFHALETMYRHQRRIP